MQYDLQMPLYIIYILRHVYTYVIHMIYSVQRVLIVVDDRCSEMGARAHSCMHVRIHACMHIDVVVCD